METIMNYVFAILEHLFLGALFALAAWPVVSWFKVGVLMQLGLMENPSAWNFFQLMISSPLFH